MSMALWNDVSALENDSNAIDLADRSALRAVPAAAARRRHDCVATAVPAAVCWDAVREHRRSHR